MYTTPGVSFLSTNGAIPIHDYYLRFSGEHANYARDSVMYAIYTTGSQPFRPSNRPVFISENGTATCRYLAGKHFSIPHHDGIIDFFQFNTDKDLKNELIKLCSDSSFI